MKPGYALLCDTHSEIFGFDFLAIRSMLGKQGCVAGSMIAEWVPKTVALDTPVEVSVGEEASGVHIFGSLPIYVLIKLFRHGIESLQVGENGNGE